MKTHYGLYENAESAIRTAYLKLKRIDCPGKEARYATRCETEGEGERDALLRAFYRFCQRNLSPETAEGT